MSSCPKRLALLAFIERSGIIEFILLFLTVSFYLMQGNVERRVFLFHQNRYRSWTICSSTFILRQIIKQVPIFMSQVHHEIFQLFHTEMWISSVQKQQQRKAVRLNKHLSQSLVFSCNSWNKNFLQESTYLNLQFHNVFDQVITDLFNVFVQKFRNDWNHFL